MSSSKVLQRNSLHNETGNFFGGIGKRKDGIGKLRSCAESFHWYQAPIDQTSQFFSSLTTSVLTKIQTETDRKARQNSCIYADALHRN